MDEIDGLRRATRGIGRADEQRQREIEPGHLEAARGQLHRVTTVAAGRIEHLSARRHAQRIDHELGLRARSAAA